MNFSFKDKCQYLSSLKRRFYKLIKEKNKKGALSIGEAPIGCSVLKEFEQHGVNINRFDEWFKEWGNNGRTYKGIDLIK